MTTPGMYAYLVEADVKAAEALCIEIGTPVYRLQRIFYSRDTPLMYLFDYVRTDVTELCITMGDNIPFDSTN